MRVPTAIVPVPVAVSRKLCCGAGAASAAGTRLHDAAAFFAGAGLLGAISFCSSKTFILSAVSAKVRRGAWKLAMLRLPLVLVDPTEALMLVRSIEFWVNCRLTLRTLIGWVSDGVFSV